MIDSSDLDLNPSSVEAHFCEASEESEASDLYEWWKTEGTLSNIDEVDLLPDN